METMTLHQCGRCEQVLDFGDVDPTEIAIMKRGHDMLCPARNGVIGGVFYIEPDKESMMKADVVKLADEFRQSLGFRTWTAQEDLARSAGHYPRRSGRTARGLLDVIARCVAYDRRVLHIVPTGVVACTDYCASMARDFIAKLRLDIRVEVETAHPDLIRPSPSHYFDHYREPRLRNDDLAWQRDIREHLDRVERVRTDFLAQPLTKTKVQPYTIEPAEIAFGTPGAGSFDYAAAFRGVDRSESPERLSGAKNHRIVKVDHARPDGFEQSKIDEIKAMLTAVRGKR